MGKWTQFPNIYMSLSPLLPHTVQHLSTISEEKMVYFLLGLSLLKHKILQHKMFFESIPTAQLSKF